MAAWPTDELPESHLARLHEDLYLVGAYIGLLICEENLGQGLLERHGK